MIPTTTAIASCSPQATTRSNPSRLRHVHILDAVWGLPHAARIFAPFTALQNCDGNASAIYHNCMYRKLSYSGEAPDGCARVSSNKRRILVVRGTGGLDRLTARLLAQETNDVRVENSTSQALKVAVKFLPDVILIDFDLPASCASALAGQLRAAPELSRVPIVFLRDRPASEPAPDDQFFPA